jgi:uncharacterized phage-associated protein
MLTSFEAAKKIGQLSGWTITNLKLQKLLYLAHLIFLGRYGRALINENFQAWNLGPVLPSVYHHLQIFGNQPIRDIFRTNIENINKDQEFSILEEVYNGLGNLEASKLVSLTHKKNGGWARNYVPKLNQTIKDQDILCEYELYYKDE